MSAMADPDVLNGASSTDALPAPAGLQLDKRQRAMLREMGIRVWSPMPMPVPVAAVPEQPAQPAPAQAQAQAQDTPVAADTAAADTRSTDNKPQSLAKNGSGMPPASPAPVLPTPASSRAIRSPAPVASAPEPMSSATSEPGWQLGQAQALYADSSAKDSAARWLVLMEAPASVLQRPAFTPFEGDVGKLLDNMLRAASLHKAAAVLLAPLVRQAGGGKEPAGSAQANLPAALAQLLASARPDVVLVMGRMAAQALLQSNDAFGRLRGQVHQLHGAATIVTHDAAYLLRTPMDKAKAWDDLCLAMSLVRH